MSYNQNNNRIRSTFSFYEVVARTISPKAARDFISFEYYLGLFLFLVAKSGMSVSLQTKQEFNLALKEELGIDSSLAHSDQLLAELVQYFRLINKLNKKIEAPHKVQN